MNKLNKLFLGITIISISITSVLNKENNQLKHQISQLEKNNIKLDSNVVFWEQNYNDLFGTYVWLGYLKDEDYLNQEKIEELWNY